MHPPHVENALSFKTLRNFGFLMAFALGLVFGAVIPLVKRGGFNPTLIVVGSVFGMLGLLTPGVLKIPYRAWMRFGEVLGAINTRLILGFVFFLVITPMAILKKLFNPRGDQAPYRTISDDRCNIKSSLERPF